IHFLEDKTVKRAFISTHAVATAFLLTLIGSSPAHSAAIPVPDGDFTLATNTGSIGGGILGGSANGAAIGSSGPWTGPSAADLGILLPPVLSISTTGGEPSGGHASKIG